MDYKDYESGVSKDFFWFKAKVQLIKILFDKLKKDKELNILDLGAGTGDDISVIKNFGKVYVIDINKEALDLISDKLVYEKKVANICDIPYPDDFFDIVVAFDVLEHIENDNKVISEINRVLKSNGNFIFTVPAFNFLYSSHDKALNHFRRYNKTDIKKLLSGFVCLNLGYWVFLLFLPIALTRLSKRNEINPKVDYIKFPAFINNIFYYLLIIENWFIKKNIILPIGTTIYGIYLKK